jgi:hypothetical protein
MAFPSMIRRFGVGFALAGICALAFAADMDMHSSMMHGSASAPPVPAGGLRVAVAFPPQLKREVLATMRMHLQGIANVQQAMAEGKYDEAAQIATMALGMSSMHGEQAQQEARYMPPGMRALGAQLHMQAGEFVLAAQNATATGDVRKPQQLLGRMLQTCVACHATYRLQ